MAYIRKGFWAIIIAVAISTLPCIAKEYRYLRASEKNVSVLVLHSYNQADVRVCELNRGLNDVFAKNTHLFDEIRFEYLDALNTGGPEYRKAFIRNFQQRYCRGKIPSLVITMGNAALEFYNEVHKSNHAEIPVVFCGLNDFSKSMLPRNPCTGIICDPDVKNTIKMIHRLQPEVDRLIFIADNLNKDTEHRTIWLKENLRKFAANYNIEYWINLPLEDMLMRVDVFSPDTAILLGNYTHDQNDQIYSPMDVARMLKAKSSVPIYSFWDYMISAGATGGSVMSPYEHGRLTAKKAIKILRGTDIRSLPIEHIDTGIMTVNWPEIERYGLDIQRLSPKPVVMDYKPGFFESFGNYIWLILGAVIFETLIVFLLIFQSYKRRASQRQLIRSRSMLRMLIDHVPNGLLTIDSRNDIVLANESLARYLETEIEELQGRNLEDIKRESPLLASKLNTHLRLTGYSNQIMNLNEMLIADRNSKDKWVNLCHLPFKAGDRKALLVMLEDTTEKKLEQEFKEQAHKVCQNILDSLPDGLMYLDRELNVKWANSSLLTTFDRTREVLIGNKCFDCKYYSNEPCQDCPAIKAIESGRVEMIQRQDPDSGRFLNIRAVPVFSGPREIVGVVEIVRDVTNEVESRMDEKTRLEMLNTIFDAIPAGVVIIDKGKNVLRANRFALDMMKVENEAQIVGQICNTRFCISEAGKCPVLDLGQHVDNSEKTLLTTDGETIPILKTVVPFMLNEEEVLLEAFIDISEYKEKVQIESQIEKLEVVGQIAGGIAPDFNDQLMAIMGYAAMLESELSDPKQIEYIRSIEAAAKHSCDITQKLLAFSRRANIVSSRVDMHSVIMNVINDIKKTLPDNVKIEKQLAAENFLITGDSAELHSSIFNVAANARDAMPDGGKILFVTDTQYLSSGNSLRQAHDVSVGNYFKWSVIDTGIGMDSGVLKHIFEPFFTTKSKSVGSGMGLASVMGIVKSHNGFIEVSSNKGLGTSVNIYIPIASQEEEATDLLDDIAAGKTLLIISPERISRKMMARAFKKKGYKVFAANNGREGIDCYSREGENIDLVLLSMEIDGPPARNVFEKMMILNSDAKVLLMVDNELNEDANFINNNGGYGYIKFPCTEARLLKAVADAIKGR